MLNISTTIKNDFSSLAIGCFDGLHLGHFKLIEYLDTNGALLVIDKFKNQRKLCTYNDKVLLSKKEVIELDFDAIKNLDGKEFLSALKNTFNKIQHIIVGYDFCFGKDRKYLAEDIQNLSGIKTTVVSEFKLDGIGVHTSLIKELLYQAKFDKAKQFLGRAYAIKGELVKGQGIGSKELFATLNLDCSEYFLPQNGVYATFSKIKEKMYKSVSFIGFRSSDSHFAVESHIIEDFNEKLDVAEHIELQFIAFIRSNQHFDDFMLLKKQIIKDIACAREILRKVDER
ncbi:bifunctional riboflavin kinase/FAD synthetase [Campylobacter sp. MIT 21-1685]|uniref:bifunctional riboflavin kinase/FAD synthetase n=1 Tax=unclassified Campylobacter TaxID=2593542 RepID=UPI00224A6EE2|nr:MULTISPECIES: bifunctional riboflavin kinase/FAD synthetase [unclassified Campylobacter]MCX2682354.1 bifunctional riboflavin kinase/FAD synthetase [Campylobacter sp. MIT 21-1684]MCX2750634.1 bifunctional riboflavin kinase/FAD synthetase [Campylobacter sp. MIT 21-1682]MCX2806818.1 bifunctional riboflavin kinase/FAD synthetase [Campylobacter sp. MIT 21-1685]